jgi:hypothetical protein
MVVPAVGALRADPPEHVIAAGSEQSVRTFYQDVRTSLSPLIVLVNDLPEALRTLASPQGAPDGKVADLARGWADDCATARDLVHRLPIPAGAYAAQAALLYETAAMLQREAAARVVQAASASTRSRRVELAQQGQRIYAFGDRMFDSAYRLLNRDGALTPSELRFPAGVPTYGDGPVPSTTADSLAQLVTERASRSQIEIAQSGLVAASADVAAQEAVTNLRLAALVAAEGSQQLRSIGARLWNGATALLAYDDGLTVRQLTPDLPERSLFRGGLFDGLPPALAPGDPVDKGVPGGVPSLDSVSLLAPSKVAR